MAITYKPSANNLDLWEQLSGYGGSINRAEDFQGLAPGTSVYSQGDNNYLFRGPDLGHRTALQTTGGINADGTVSTGRFKPHQRISGGALLGEGLSLAALAFGGLGALGAGPLAGTMGGLGIGPGAAAGDVAAGVPGGVLSGGMGGATGGVGASLGTPAVGAGMTAANPYNILAANAAGASAGGGAVGGGLTGLEALTAPMTLESSLAAGGSLSAPMSLAGSAGSAVTPTLGGLGGAGMASTGGASWLENAASWLGKSAKDMKAGDWLQIASGLFDASRAGGRDAGQIDPFGAYRPGYARQLAELMNNPASVTKLPGYKAGLDASEQALIRQHAAVGGLGGGGLAEALAKHAAQYQDTAFDQQLSRLAGFSGAGFNNAAQGAQWESSGDDIYSRLFDRAAKLSIFNR